MHRKPQLLSSLSCSCRLPHRSVPLSQTNIATRALSTHERILPPSHPPPPPPPPHLNRKTVTRPREERALLRSRVFPVGSRRRRAALIGSKNIPFAELPYQCFQEARKILQEDRKEKVHQTEVQRDRIEKLKKQDVSVSGGVFQKDTRLASMRRHLERLKVLADINDPEVKKRFEDGMGDMNRPIYRHLAREKWHARKRLITEQRIKQMNVAPDVLPSISISADVDLYFHGQKHLSKVTSPRLDTVGHRIIVQPGEFVASAVSEHAPRLEVQVFDKGMRYVTIAVVDSDVPNLETDTFGYRCHFLGVNIPVSPTERTIRLSQSKKSQLILSWMPPYAQKGSPYHRLSILVLQQPASGDQGSSKIDVSKAAEKVTRDGFSLRAFTDRHSLHTIGAHLFRVEWDEYMDDVMRRNGYEGAGVELKRRKVEKLPYKYKKSDGAKYRGG